MKVTTLAIPLSYYSVQSCGIEHSNMKVVKVLKLELKFQEFNLEKAVCNHGFFMMAPNHWIPSTSTLRRPLHLADSSKSILVSISHSPDDLHSLLVQLHTTRKLSPADHSAILEQVRRMLRIAESEENNIREFQKMNTKAKENGLGRIFRSPTVFEDAVKCLILCNTSWSSSLRMAEELCKLQAELERKNTKKKGRKRKRATKIVGDDFEMGNFPNSKEMARMEVGWLEEHSIIGYRGKYIVKLAKEVERGRLNLEKMEEEASLSHSPLRTRLSCMKGFGQFARATLLMCMGHYQQVPVDTETLRHLKQVHGRELEKKKPGVIRREVESIYSGYAPFQCLAYWVELVEFYETKFGKLSQLSKDKYYQISGSTTRSTR